MQNNVTRLKDFYDTQVSYRVIIENKIVVNSDGTGDQKGTKADIKVKIDDKVVNMQMSLKTTGGDQIGQMSGITFDRQIKMFEKLSLDVDVSKRKNYEEKLKYFISMDIQRDLIKSNTSKEFRRYKIAKTSKMHLYIKEAAKQLQAIFKKDDAESLKSYCTFSQRWYYKR